MNTIKIFLTVLGMALIAGLLWLLPKPPSAALPTPQNIIPTSTPAPEKENIVYVDEAGFSPSEIRIKQGEMVIFKNRGKEPHWPASNIHPTHQIYPEFDPLNPIFPGESWSFKFDKSGNWKMHDHIYANHTGVIIVESFGEPSNTEKAKEKIGVPPTPANVEDALKGINMMEIAKDLKQIEYWMKKVGPEAMMNELLRDSGNGETIDCHQPAHYIGRVAFELFGAQAIKYGSPSCHSGYYHGAIESFLKEKGTVNLVKNVEDLCSVFNTSFGKFECLHGVGHGLLAYEDYDLPKTIETCKKLSTDFDRRSCFGGMFMENVVTGEGLGAGESHETEWLSKTDLHFPCNKINQDYGVQYECYQMQTSWMLWVFNYDFNKVKSECLNAREDMIPVCYKSFGRDAAGNSLRNVPSIVGNCGKIANNQEYYSQCVIGALNAIIDFWGAGLKDQATELCKAVLPLGKQACYGTIAWRLDDVFGNQTGKKAEICAGFEEGYKNLCS
jgi:hypothetical protein